MAKILIVEDSPELLVFMGVLLKHNNYNIEVAANKSQLHQQLPAFAPDVILLDVKLEGLDGRDICREIKATAAYSHIPIILLSADPELLLSYAEYNATAVIEKPFDIQVLMSKIDDVITAVSPGTNLR